MNGSSHFGYMQARLQARHGLRPSETTWQVLEASLDLGHYLQVARNSTLRAWVERFQSDTPADVIERHLRADWNRYIALVAGWAPAAWRDAVNWLSSLAYLPAAIHLLRGLPAIPWMAKDPVLRDFIDDNLESRRARLETSQLAPIARAWGGRATVHEAWLSHWHALWPEADSKTLTGLAVLEESLTEHLRQISEGTAGMDGAPLRAKLASRFTRVFRIHARTPAALFGHLGLIALDLERLRGSLVRLSLFSERGSHA